MNSGDKSATLIAFIIGIVFLSLFIKGCQQSDNQVRLKAIEKGCLLLYKSEYDCRSK
jgi:hypothetical protein